MKKTITILSILALIISISCKKKSDPAPEETPAPSVNNDNYSSMQSFFNTNGAQMQTFTLNAITGGTFVSAKATTISIPANAFTDLVNVSVTGTVAIDFKDIYSKADMLLSGACTNAPTGPLESAGEFYIKASSASNPLKIAAGKNIVVKQPVQPLAVANASMMPFMAGVDTLGNVNNWNNDSTSSLSSNPSYYIYSLYSFDPTPSNGTWCNSDNSSFFSMYPQTSIKLVVASSFTNSAEVYLVFKNVNSMVHVYPDYPLMSNHTYSYAPLGLQCTAVAVGINNSGKVYSAFSALTITAMQSVTLSLTETTAADFKAAVKALQ